MFYEYIFDIEEPCSKAISSMVHDYLMNPDMDIQVSVRNVSIHDINLITRAFVESQCKAKSISHTVRLIFQDGASRLFHLNGKNKVTKRNIHRTVE